MGGTWIDGMVKCIKIYQRNRGKGGQRVSCSMGVSFFRGMQLCVSFFGRDARIGT